MTKPETVQSDVTLQAASLDLSGLKCPLPALRTAKALKGISNGQILVVTCTDPLAAIDIPNLIRETGHELLRDERTNDRLIFTIRKAC